MVWDALIDFKIHMLAKTGDSETFPAVPQILFSQF
jgi:hypothetical protein